MSAPWDPPPTEQQAAAPSPAPAPIPGEPTEPPGDATPAESDVDWHHLHRITPLLNAWKVAAVLLGIAVWNQADELAQLEASVGVKALIVVGVLVLGALVGLVYSAIAWRRTRYGISDDSIVLHSGVLWRQQRHVRLARLQAVDVTQPLLARLFGFASLKIESAGGGESNITLSYLTEEEAQRLRNEILARAAGVRPSAATAAVPPPEGTASGTSPAPPVVAVEAPERPVLELAPSRLIASLVLSIGVMLAVLALVAFVVVLVVTQSLRAIGGALPMVLGAGGYVWQRFAGEFAFRIGLSADGVRLRHGLLEAKARTVPPGRVQAISITQPPLWRRFGWWRLQVNIAGYGPTEETSSVLFPVATTAEVARILPLVLPDLGTDRPLEVLHAGLTGTGSDEGFVTSSRRARRIDPLVWQRTGFRVTDTAVMLRTGRWWRSLVLVPHERTQSLALTQGPIERRLGLAGVVLHSTPGRVTPQISHLDLEVARDFLLEQAERARAARRHAGPEQWMRRPEPATVADSPVDPTGPPSDAGGVLPTPGPRP